jgi:hypothetical protein
MSSQSMLLYKIQIWNEVTYSYGNRETQVSSFQLNVDALPTDSVYITDTLNYCR